MDPSTGELSPSGADGRRAAGTGRGRPVTATGDEGAMVVDTDVYRHVMGRLAKGVAVVTTTASGHHHALTADSVTSVSLDPVLLLVCVETDARFHDAVHRARCLRCERPRRGPASHCGRGSRRRDVRCRARWTAPPTRSPPRASRCSTARSRRSSARCATCTPRATTASSSGRSQPARLSGDPKAALVHFRGQYSALP